MQEVQSRRDAMYMELEDLARKAIRLHHREAIRSTVIGSSWAIGLSLAFAIAQLYGFEISWHIHVAWLGLVLIAVGASWMSYGRKKKRFRLGLYGQEEDEAERIGQLLAERQMRDGVPGPNSFEGKMERLARMMSVRDQQHETKAPPDH